MKDHVKALQVLLVEDNPADAVLVDERLSQSRINFSLVLAESLADALAQINGHRFDVILLDLSLTDSAGIDTFTRVAAEAPETPIVVLSGREDDELVVQAVRNGAQDFLLKGAIDSGILNRSIRYAIERTKRQRVEKELRSAVEIQRRLIPKGRSHINGFDISGRCVPAKYVGGDYFDFFPMANGKTGVVIGDAAGHGIGPAMTMTETRAAIRAFASVSNDAGEILSRTSRLLSRDLTEQTFVALFLACLDRKSAELQYAAAGHHGSILDARGRERERLSTSDPPLGIESYTYKTSPSIKFGDGESLFLYTDGFVDCENSSGSRFGRYRLMESMQRCSSADVVEVLQFVFEQFSDFIGNTRRSDDVSAVLVRPRPVAEVSNVVSAKSDAAPRSEKAVTATQHFDYSRVENHFTVILRNSNILTTEDCFDLQSALFELVRGKEPENFAISLENVERFSSEAINVLLRLRKLLDSNQKRVVLCRLSNDLKDAFRALNLIDTVFPIADDMKSAIELFDD